MAQNVTEALLTRSEALVERLVKNPDLCNIVLALLSRCIVLCHQRAMPIEGIAIGPLMASTLSNGDLIIRAPVVFNQLSMSAPAMFPLQSDFAQFARAKAQGLALALQKNPKLGVFFQILIETVDRYSRDRGIAFSALVSKQAIISTPGDILVLKLGRKLLDA